MSWLAADVATIAFLWRIERRDGVTLGFTSHDRDLFRDGLLYRAAPGMVPAAIESDAGLEGARNEVRGALSAAAIRAADLAAGRWDGAAVVLMACDWSAPAPPVGLGRGTLGMVEMAGGGFTAELAGLETVLDREAAEATSPECRAELGDRRCRVAMAGRRMRARVTAVDDATFLLDGEVADRFGWGRLRWLDGANAGLSAAIHSSDGRTVRLVEPPAFAAGPGDAVELIEGCDKRWETCRDRFANAANFRGEPFLPGMDLLTRYPGG